MDIDREGTWTIPHGRYKTKIDHAVPLSTAAKALIEAMPKRGIPIFTTNGKTSFSGFSKSKRRLDARMAELRAKANEPPIEPWVLHDLRRTARTLMARLGVEAERLAREWLEKHPQ